jgi:hypothetical protein
MRPPPEILLAQHDEPSFVSTWVDRMPVALAGMDKVNEVRITDYGSIGVAAS